MSHTFPVQMRCCGARREASIAPQESFWRGARGAHLDLARHEERLELLGDVGGPVRNVEVADDEDEHLRVRVSGQGGEKWPGVAYMLAGPRATGGRN